MKKIIFFLLLSGVAFLPGDACAEDLTFGGHYKNLFITSEASTGEHYYLDTNRLRLEIDKQADPWQFHLELDNEALIHDFRNTPDFEYIRSREQEHVNSWDADEVSVDEDHLYLKHTLYRAYVKYFNPTFQAVVGKQAIDWGKMRFYSPLDLFNPLGPIELERDYRIGVDAVNLNYALGDFSGVGLILAPGEDPGHSRYGATYYTKLGTYDVSLSTANILDDMVVGAAFDGYLKAAGFRGEITQTWEDDDFAGDRNYIRAALGLDYNFTEKIYLLLEQLYNGGHSDNNPASVLFSARQAAKTLSLEKNLSSVWFQYKFTPVFEGNTYLIYDWDGESGVVNPELKKEIMENTTVALGAQFFWGESDSEFGSLNHLYYAELKWHF